MKLVDSFPLQLFTCIGAATYVAAAAKVPSRGLSLSAAEFSSQAYDYIVVGGGTAGLAVASRLAENPKVSVGVIEAGQHLADDVLINTPAFASQLWGNAKYDWMFRSAPQANLNNRVLNLPRGKVLGGTSAINAMAFDRAPEAEYDAWASLGNPGWNWTDLLPYMKAAEHFTEADPFRVNDTGTNANPTDIFPSQGTNGPIAASYNSWYSDVVTPYGKAITNLGIPPNFNPDSGDTFGFFNSARAVNRTTGQRSYAANTYYAYNAHRPNFVVLTGAQATKVEFKKSTSGKRNGELMATGVSFVYNSTSFSVTAKKEVILSAGSYQTPQLLEFSGIGNSTILRQYGIPPLVELPGVGENLQDHPGITTVYELKPGVTTLDILRNNATYAAAAQAQYASTRDGILTTTGTTLAFFNLDLITSRANIANMITQLDREISSDRVTPLQWAQYVIQKDWLGRKLGHIEIILNPVYSGATPKENTSYISLSMVNQHPFSRGSIHINSSDPLAAPRINPNYLSKSFDLDSLVQSVQFGLKISQTEPLASLIVGRDTPPPQATSEVDVVEFVKANIIPMNHPIGTAILAPRALGGVVDTKLKVYGTSNLRVADASIIPIQMGTHISRTVYGIGEKAAAIIEKGSH